MPNLTRQLPPSQFDRSTQLSGLRSQALAAPPPPDSARVQELALKVQDNLELGATAETGLGQKSRQLNDAIRQLQQLSGSGEQASVLSALQRFQSLTLPQNLQALATEQAQLQEALKGLPQELPKDSPQRAGLELQLRAVSATLELYQEAQSLLASSPLLQPVRSETPTSTPETGLSLPGEQELAQIAPQLGLSEPELRGVFRALESNIEGLNALSNRVDGAKGTYARENAGFLRSAGALKTLFKALKGVVSPGAGANGEALSGSAAVIARTRSLLTFLMESRRLQQSNAELAGQLGLLKLNQGVGKLISNLPNQGLQNILNRYIGNTNRTESAEAKQRIADLGLVLEYLSGEHELDAEIGRALFELVLDNGADAVKGLGELLPAAARERYQQTIDRIQSKLNTLVQRLGSEAPSFLRGLVESSPESARQIFRFVLEDGAGKYAAVVDLVNNLAKSESALRLLGEGGQKNLQALAEFLSLDTIGLGYLRTALSSSSTPAARLNAFNNLAKDILKDKLPLLSEIELPSFERAVGQALDRVAQTLGLDSASAARILQNPQATEALTSESAPAARAEQTELKLETARPELAAEPRVKPGVEPQSKLRASEPPAPESPARATEAPRQPSEARAADTSSAPEPTAGKPGAEAASARPAAEAERTAVEASERLSGEAGNLLERQAQKLARYNLSPEAEASLMRLLRQNPEQADEVVKALGKIGKDSADKLETILKVIAEMEPARALNLLTGEGLGAKLLKQVLELVPALQRFGLSLTEIVPKLGRALGKAVPAVGALVSAYDAARMGQIALNGSYGGKAYADKEVRALALLGASTNALDTLLGVAEAFGIGNVAFPLQLGLAAGSLAIDIMVEYFNDNPQAMPEGLRKAIRYTAAATAVAAPFAIPGAGLAASAAITNIYGADGVVDILGDLTHDLGTGAIQGADRLTRLHAKVLDQDLATLSGGIHGLSDVIRHPERYAQALGKDAAEVLAEAKQWLIRQAQSGVQAATEVFAVLKDIVSDPVKYAAAAREFALEMARDIGKSVSNAAAAARDFIVEGAVQGWIGLQNGIDTLLEMGAEGIQAAAELGKRMLQAGGEAASKFISFATDVVQNPGKYGQILIDGFSSALAAGWQVTREGLNLVVDLAGQGLEKAGEFLSTVVSKGGELAVYGLNLLRNAPQAAKEALIEGFNLALETGKAGIEMVQYVINNPAEAAAAAGQKAVELFSRSRDWLVDQVKDAGRNIKAAFENLEQFYHNTTAYLGDLGGRLDAAIGRFEDTVVDLVGQGLDVGREALSRYADVLTRRLPELLNAWQDLAQAPLDLMVRIGRNAAEAGAQVAQYLATKATELGTQALEGLGRLGSAGLEQLSNLARAGGQMARKALTQLSELGDAGYRAISRLAQSTGEIASEAFDLIASSAKKGLAIAQETLSNLAREAGELGRQAIYKLSELGDWGAKQIQKLVAAGSDNLRTALSALANMGSAGLEALENLAKSGAKYARQAFDTLVSKGAAAINQLRDLVTATSAYAREAFNTLVSYGEGAIDALKSIGTKVADFADDAIAALGRMGGVAEAAILEIGKKFSQYADEAITALKGLGQRAIESIEALANKYTQLRGQALKALSEIGASARQAMNRMVDQMWASGQAGVSALLNAAGDLAEVSSMVYRKVSSSLSRGWERSTIDWNPLDSRDTDLSPLLNEVAGLMNAARSAGQVAYRQAREMALRALRDLGLPAFALSAVQKLL